MIDLEEYTVEYLDQDWKNKMLNVLRQGKTVKIISRFEDIDNLRNELIEQLLNPIEIDGVELFYPYIEKINITNNECSISLSIREVLHE
ncbi:MAG: hypothetical protein ACOCRO_08565 [Halanaerobiales bacterium]